MSELKINKENANDSLIKRIGVSLVIVEQAKVFRLADVTGWVKVLPEIPSPMIKTKIYPTQKLIIS